MGIDRWLLAIFYQLIAILIIATLITVALIVTTLITATLSTSHQSRYRRMNNNVRGLPHVSKA